MDGPTWKKFIDVIAFVLVFAIPVILYLMEKAGESLVKIFALGWISVAVAAIYLVLNIPWVWEETQFAVRLWRLFFVSSVAVLVVGYMALQIWPIHGEETTSKANSSTAPINGVNVDFGAFFLNMSQNLNSLGWWGIYDSGATISPISLVMRVTLTNVGEKPENIGHYSLAVKTQECGSVYLTPIDPRAVPQLAVVSKSLGFNKVPIFNFVDDSLIEKLKKPLLPHIPVQGWLLFDTPTTCSTSKGSTVSFRLELQSISGDISFLKNSENKVLSDDIPATTVGDIFPAELHAIGGWLDLGEAKRKVWHD